MFNRYLRLSVTVFLLTYTAADLLVSGVCRTDEGTTAFLRLNAGATTSVHLTLQSASVSLPIPVPTSPDRPHEDDCFCCCSHSMPSLVPSLPILAVQDFPFRLPSIHPSIPSLLSVYHPPRMV